MIRGGGGSHQSAQASGNAHHQHLGNGDVEAIGIRDGNKGHHSSSDGRTRDTHLRGNRSHTTGTLWTDAFLQGNVADDRHQGVDHMTRSHQYGEKESAEGSEERDAVGMLAQHPFCNLDEPVHTARGLHHTSTGNGGDDDIDDACRGRTRLHAEAENKQGQTDARYGTKGQTAIARTHIEG